MVVTTNTNQILNAQSGFKDWGTNMLYKKGEANTYLLAKDNLARIPRVDAKTHALDVVDYAHHEIHGGSAFVYDAASDIAGSTTVSFTLTTPNCDSDMHC